MSSSTMIPIQPKDTFRVTLELQEPEERMDNVLLNALREQDENNKLKAISRKQLKELFAEKRILIKGQRAKSSSAIARGITYVDIQGFSSSDN
jgi:hypothetical protein